MNKPNPFFTLIIPTHKRPHLLRRALESVVSQAMGHELQIIVVSDSLEAETSRVCAELLSEKDTFLRISPCTVADARNTALLLAKGRYVFFLDDDDAWHPGVIEYLLQQPAIQRGEFVYFNCTRVIERRPPSGPEFIEEADVRLVGQLTENVYVRNQVHMSCFAFPRHVIGEQRFDPLLRTFEDWDFLLALFDKQSLANYLPLKVSRVYEVNDDTTDRLSNLAANFGAGVLLDYLYIYRRHPALSEPVRQQRSELMKAAGLHIDRSFL